MATAAQADVEGFAVRLATASPDAWLDAVLNDFDAFLLDHASNERKASAQALSLVAHYADRPRLVETLIELAREELAHFQQVVRIAARRGLALAPDRPDAYVHALRASIRRGPEAYFLDRLLVSAVVEARGCERFGRIASAISDALLARFYREIADSEARHAALFVELAALYFERPIVRSRLAELSAEEAAIVYELAIRPALH